MLTTLQKPKITPQQRLAQRSHHLGWGVLSSILFNLDRRLDRTEDQILEFLVPIRPIKQKAHKGLKAKLNSH